MDILTHYFLFSSSVQNNKEVDNAQRDFSLVKKMFNQSTVYAFDCKKHHAILDNFVNTSTTDTSKCELILPHPYMYIGFDETVLTATDQVFKLTGVLISKGTMVLLLFDGAGFTTTVIYRDGVRVADTKTTTSMFLYISAIVECINAFPKKVINRQNNKEYSRIESKYNKKKRLRSIPFYYEVSQDTLPVVKLDRHLVVTNYLQMCLSVNSSEEPDKLKYLAEAIDDAKLYQIQHNKFSEFIASIQYEQFVNDLKAKFANKEDAHRYIIDTFKPDDLHLPHKKIYVGFVNPPGFMTIEDRRDILIGFVLSDITMYMHALNTSDNTQYTMCLCKNLIWDTTDAASLANTILIIKALMLYINSFNSVVVNQSTDGSFERTCKAINTTNQVSNPPCYYTVGLKRNNQVDVVKILNKLRRECTYAYDVRGHKVHRIVKGTLPIDAKTEAYLKKDERRKIFYSPEEIDKDNLTILSERGYVIQEGEWVAVLPIHRKGHIANLKGGKNPYIPSVHVD